jgi:phage anti-repressor protein
MSVDIVNLIESNPIAKLIGNYQSAMVDKIKARFNTYEQQMFVSSFYCYLNYDEGEFVIDLDSVWQWLAFSQKIRAKELLEKNFVENTDYTIIAPQHYGAKKDARGGHNKETIMLTIPAFKRFCLKAGTKKANEIHEYYLKMEKIIQEVVIEECKSLSEQLKVKDQEIVNKDAEIAKRDAEYQTKLKKQKEFEREKVLLNQFAVSIPIVYLIRVKTHPNGEYIVKIGESRRGILQRYNEHKSHYPECVLLDVFTAIQSKDFEVYIHNHPKIRCNQVRDMPGHESEKELFLVGKNLTYQILLDVINSQIDNFQEHNTKKLELEVEKLKLMAANNGGNNPTIIEILDTTKRLEQTLTTRINKLETMLDKLLETKAPVARTQTGFQEPLPTLGPRVQKINPDTLQLIKVYESATEVMNEDRSIKRPSLSKAVLENVVYNGFRWLFVERDVDPTVLHNLQPTRKTIPKNMDYVAKLNADQTEILNVYLDRKTAALTNRYSSGGLDSAVKNGTVSQGHYYKLYGDCPEPLVEKFEERYGKDILLYKDGFGMFHETTHQLVKEFKCKYDCLKSEKISDKTLAKAMREDKAYNGFKYKELPPRVSCY